MPERAVYDEAILLSQARLKVPDRELTEGKVEKFTIKTAVGSMERPWGIEGGFAVVYKFRSHSGTMMALRCFRVPMDPDTQFRYERISEYFAKYIPSITAKFKYHNQGIVVKEIVQGQRQNVVYPVIEMEWVDGMTLLEYVDELCRKRDRAGLKNIVQQWLEMMRALQRANISHGDLAGVNVMVRKSDGHLILVDYDGVYIPEFGSKGLRQIVLGQADYQHHDMNNRPFNEHTDAFSAYVIYTSLLALYHKPELWDKYTTRENGKLLNMNLLFLQQDFVNPTHSALMRDMATIADPQFKDALRQLREACHLPVGNVRFTPRDPEAEMQEAIEKLRLAIQKDHDEAIIALWTPVKQFPAAQQYATRVALAEQRIQALKRFRDALQSKSIQLIATSYDANLLDGNVNLTLQERACQYYAQRFYDAYQKDDDYALVETWEEMQQGAQIFFTLTQQEQQRLAVAQQRKAALLKFRIALLNKRPADIVSAYDSAILDQSQNISKDERDLLNTVRAFVDAYKNGNDDALVAAADDLQHFTFRTRITLSNEEQRRIESARQRKIALTKLRIALANKRIQAIAAAYDDILNGHKEISNEQHQLIQLAKRFRVAYHTNNDAALLTVYKELQNASFQQQVIFSPEEKTRLEQAQMRFEQVSKDKAQLDKFHEALKSKQIKRIAADFDPRLEKSGNITQQELALAQLAQEFVRAIQTDDDKTLLAVYYETQSSTYRQILTLTAQEQQHLDIAQKRNAALGRFRLALISKRLKQIEEAYDPLLKTSKNMTQTEHELLTLAQRFMRAYRDEDDKAIVAAWTAIQNSPQRDYFILTQEEQQRIKQGLERGGPAHA